jgi:hypothetical protein
MICRATLRMGITALDCNCIRMRNRGLLRVACTRTMVRRRLGDRSMHMRAKCGSVAGHGGGVCFQGCRGQVQVPMEESGYEGDRDLMVDAGIRRERRDGSLPSTIRWRSGRRPSTTGCSALLLRHTTRCSAIPSRRGVERRRITTFSRSWGGNRSMCRRSSCPRLAVPLGISRTVARVADRCVGPHRRLVEPRRGERSAVRPCCNLKMPHDLHVRSRC